MLRAGEGSRRRCRLPERWELAHFLSFQGPDVELEAVSEWEVVLPALGYVRVWDPWGDGEELASRLGVEVDELLELGGGSYLVPAPGSYLALRSPQWVLYYNSRYITLGELERLWYGTEGRQRHWFLEGTRRLLSQGLRLRTPAPLYAGLEVYRRTSMATAPGQLPPGVIVPVWTPLLTPEEARRLAGVSGWQPAPPLWAPAPTGEVERGASSQWDEAAEASPAGWQLAHEGLTAGGAWAPAIPLEIEREVEREATPVAGDRQTTVDLAGAAESGVEDALGKTAECPASEQMGVQETGRPKEGRQEAGRHGRRAASLPRPGRLLVALDAVGRTLGSVRRRPDQGEREEETELAVVTETLRRTLPLFWSLELPRMELVVAWAQGRRVRFGARSLYPVSEQVMKGAIRRATHLRPPLVVERLGPDTVRVACPRLEELGAEAPGAGTLTLLPYGEETDSEGRRWFHFVEPGGAGGLLVRTTRGEMERWAALFAGAARAQCQPLEVWATTCLAEAAGADRAFATAEAMVDVLWEEATERLEGRARSLALALLGPDGGSPPEEKVQTLAARSLELGLRLVAFVESSRRAPALGAVLTIEGLRTSLSWAGGRWVMQAPVVEGLPPAPAGSGRPGQIGAEGTEAAPEVAPPGAATEEGEAVREEEEAPSAGPAQGVTEGRPEEAAPATLQDGGGGETAGPGEAGELEPVEDEAAAEVEALPVADVPQEQAGQSGEDLGGPAAVAGEEGDQESAAPASEGGRASGQRPEMESARGRPQGVAAGDERGAGGTGEEEGALERPGQETGVVAAGERQGEIVRRARLSLLGTLETDLRPDRPRPALELLAMLGVAGGALLMDDVAERLEHVAGESGAQALRTVYKVVHSVNQAGRSLGLERVMAVEAQRVVLLREAVDCDLWEALALAQQVEESDGGNGRALAALASLIKGPILGRAVYGWRDELVAPAEDALQSALLLGAERQLEEEPALAQRAAQACLRLDPLCEAAMDLEVRALALQGRLREAERALEDYQRRVEEAMGKRSRLLERLQREMREAEEA